MLNVVSKTIYRGTERNQTIKGSETMLFNWTRWVFGEICDLWRELDLGTLGRNQVAEHGRETYMSLLTSLEKAQHPIMSW